MEEEIEEERNLELHCNERDADMNEGSAAQQTQQKCWVDVVAIQCGQ